VGEVQAVQNELPSEGEGVRRPAPTPTPDDIRAQLERQTTTTLPDIEMIFQSQRKPSMKRMFIVIASDQLLR